MCHFSLLFEVVVVSCCARDSLRKSFAASYAAKVIAVATTDFTVVGTIPYAVTNTGRKIHAVVVPYIL